VPTIKSENIDRWWALRSRTFPTLRYDTTVVIASEAKQSIVTSCTERWIASLRSQ